MSETKLVAIRSTLEEQYPYCNKHLNFEPHTYINIFKIIYFKNGFERARERVQRDREWDF